MKKIWISPIVLLALWVGALTAHAQVAQQGDDDAHITPRVPEKVAPSGKRKLAVPDTQDTKGDTTDPAGPIMPGESSSRETRVDLSPPKDEKQAYPNSDVSEEVHEMKPWDPHKAQKDVEVGDYYYKRGNYRGAMMRYQSALTWQDNDAEAMWKAGLAAEKLNDKATAAQFYAKYLKTLPRGEHAGEAQQALARLK